MTTRGRLRREARLIGWRAALAALSERAKRLEEHMRGPAMWDAGVNYSMAKEDLRAVNDERRHIEKQIAATRKELHEAYPDQYKL